MKQKKLFLIAFMEKYYKQRHRYFSKFDEGIQIVDDQSWFSVTPELIAKHIAERSSCDVMVDAFCGIGGNTIQFAMTCKKVIAIEVRPDFIEQARHNACIYGVEDKIEFIVGDFFQIYPTLPRVDGVFLSPPWGGPEYLNLDSYDLNMLQPIDGFRLIEFCRSKCRNIIFYLPRNTNIKQIKQLAEEGDKLELEQNFLNDKLKVLTVYFGKFCHEQ